MSRERPDCLWDWLYEAVESTSKPDRAEQARKDALRMIGSLQAISDVDRSLNLALNTALAQNAELRVHNMNMSRELSELKERMC